MEEHQLMIRRETPADYEAVEALTREAFWNVYRPGCTEHYVLHTFRSNPDFVPELDLVLEKEVRLIGHIMYARSHIQADDGRIVPTMTFGPISIHPDVQRQGYGKRLLDASMEQAKRMGAGALCIEGNIDFYGKSGFVVAGTRGIRHHGAPEQAILPHFLLCELQEGFLDGVTGIYYTPAGYFVEDEAAEAFDRTFPPKVKLKLPGQLV